MATRVRRAKRPSSKYRVICDECNGRGYSLPSYAKSWDAAERCERCCGTGEVCAACGAGVPKTDPPTAHGCVGPADPADVMTISAYYANLPHWQVDDVWTRNGHVYTQVSPRVRLAEVPPDATIYRYALVERPADGADAIRFEEVGWLNGMTGLTTWNDDAEQAYEDAR